MPIFESCCAWIECDLYCVPVEFFTWHATDKDPACEHCGCPTNRLVSTFNAPWTGDLSRFHDPTKDRHNSTKEGHIAYRVKSSRLGLNTKTGQPIPEPVRIGTRQEMVAFAKSEGLEDPFGINQNQEITSDGMVSSTRLRGSWV